MVSITTGKALEAMAALEEIRGQRICKEKAKELYLLRKKLMEAYEFYREEQAKIVKDLEIETGENGDLLFGKDTEKLKKYQAEKEELMAVWQEIGDRKIDLSGEEMDISEAFLEATEDLIII